MQNLFQDLHYGARLLIRSPLFAFTVILTLALGIGGNSAVFRLIDTVVFRPLPYQDADRLMMIWQTSPGRSQQKRPIYPPQLFSELQEQSQVFEQTAAFVGGGTIGFDLVGEGKPERAPGAVVSADLFSMLRVQASIGRAFFSHEDAAGNDQVVILSHNLWRRRFNADPGLIGKTLLLNGLSYQVVGVMPADFNFPDGAQLWVPNPLQADKAMNAVLLVTHSLNVVARLKPGVTRRQAQASLDDLARRLQQGGVNEGMGFRLVPLHEELFGNIRPALWILWGAVSLVLLIACANVANLLLVRAAARKQEIAIRLALGASRLRLIRQLLTESVLLAMLGGGLGCFFSYWAIRTLPALIPTEISDLKTLSVDYRMIGFTLAGSLLTGILFGLAPALQASKPDLHESLKEGARSSTLGVRHHRLLRILVVSEIALALLLLIGAGLMTKSFLHLTRTDLGFDAKNVLTVKISPPGWKYRDQDQQLTLYQRIIDRIKALPGVQRVGAINLLPLRGDGFQVIFLVEGQPAPASGEYPTANCSSVSADYFRAMGIPLVKGRFFTERDTADSPKVLIIDQAMARRFWPNEEPIGKRLNWQGSWREVVGIAGEVKPIGSVGRVGQVAQQMYAPQTQFDFPWPSIHLAIRTTTADPSSITTAVLSAIWAEDKDQPVDQIRTVEQLISDAVSRQRFTMLLLVIFAAMSLVLGAVGIYGVMAYSVAQRTHEIGIRMALGARGSDVLTLVIRQGLVLIMAGVTIGLAGALALTRVLSGFLYGVGATDPATFVESSGLLAGAALLACYIPARKATKVDPMIVLRNE